MNAFFVDAERDRPEEAGPLRMRYVAMAETPAAAVEAVRTLVSAETVLHATGGTLSLHIARAIGIRPGQAKLV